MMIYNKIIFEFNCKYQGKMKNIFDKILGLIE